MRRAWWSWLLLAVCIVPLLARSGSVHAQESVPIGARVRITTPTDRIEGTLLERTGALYKVQDSRDSVLTVEDASIRRLDVAAGRRSNVWRGMAIGAGVGAVTTVVYVAVVKPCPRCEIPVTKSGAAALGGLFTVATTAIGAGIGALSHRTRWQRVRPAPTGIGLSISF
jgi:hypothetical protein